MYAYSDDEWKMVRKLEPVYQESKAGASEESACIGYQETFYENGEMADGRLLEVKDDSAVWFDEKSVWCKDNAVNVQLYPGEEWQEITIYINQMEWKKYVRCQK
ncbi:MAG: hypothetical protein NC548_02300 [Lachnospiraceae bacterium]|nr:hypothetical protein [Lachnospiraceae bacterium]